MAKRGANEGSIYKRRDGRWCAALRVPGRRRPVVRYARTQAAAIEALDGLRRLARAHALPGKRPTVREVLSAWLEVRSATVRAKTLATYGEVVEQHIIPTLGSVHVDALTVAHVQLLMATKRNSGLSARSVNLIGACCGRGSGRPKGLALLNGTSPRWPKRSPQSAGNRLFGLQTRPRRFSGPFGAAG